MERFDGPALVLGVRIDLRQFEPLASDVSGQF